MLFGIPARLTLCSLLAIPLTSRTQDLSQLAQRIAHTDPAKYKHLPSVHNGSGPMDYMALFDIKSPQSAKFNLGTNLFFLHRGVLPPNGGIGAHFHNHCEEMFIILDGESQFTIDGRRMLVEHIPATWGNRDILSDSPRLSAIVSD